MDTPEITPERASFPRPADYYASPVQVAQPLFPRWVPFGCGTASIVLIIALLLMAAGISSGAFGTLFEMMFGQMQGEVEKMMTADVTPQQKAAFGREMKTMRSAIGANRLPPRRLQPLMRTMRQVISDERVTGPEVDQLTREMHAINQPRR